MKTPIAIIGIGCRFPGGADSPEKYWELACNGVDAIGPVPPERWKSDLFFHSSPQAPGKAYVRKGGFLDGSPFAFDSLFFGISSREAEALDPQQKMLLEVTYEAIEDAGLQLDKLKNSRTGVFIGGFSLDNMLEQLNYLNLELCDSYTPASLSMTMLSNRLSYVFGLQGPSMTVDTACSSSLVATHLGCQSLWSGDSDLAIIGGVSLLLRPEFFVLLSKGRFLSDHGHCMSFAQTANGYARAEGAGIAILKPLPKALDDGDRIWAVIRNTGVNQDGTTPGISSPNQLSQEALLARVLQQEGIAPADIRYAEAHGTGTQAGDRAEANALSNVLSQGRKPGDKCLVGSIKSNIGHTEAAAGIAGLIKAALVVGNGRIPPNLHFDTPNAGIPFRDLCIRVPTRLEEWPRHDAKRLACVSSFGYGGTNACAILQAPPSKSAGCSPCDDPEGPKTPSVIPLSARSKEALQQLAKEYLSHLDTLPDEQWRDIAHSMCFRRSHLKHRVALLASDKGELRHSLDLFARGETPTWGCSGTASGERPLPLVFVYTGMGAQYPRMGMELFATEPVFRDTILRCEEIFARLSGLSIVEELAKDEATSGMGDTGISQPANFVIQAALSDLLQSWGIRPDVVVGHSVGEVAAAYVSGALSLEDALTLSWHRGRLQQSLSGSGSLLAVELTEEEAADLLERVPDLSIAAINGRSSLTLAGRSEQLEAARAIIAGMGRFNRSVNVTIPFHSAEMERIRHDLLESLSALQPNDSAIPLYSTVTGAPIPGGELTARYWWQNVREPVRFSAAVKNILAEHGDCNFLEVGPHPVLRASLLQGLAAAGSEGRPVQTMNRKTAEVLTVGQAIGNLFCLGYLPEWKGAAATGGYVKLPGYPWQREELTHRRSDRARQQLHGLSERPLLVHGVDAPFPSWHIELHADALPYLADHRVSGEIVVPGAVYLEAGLEAHAAAHGCDPCILEQVSFTKMLVLDDAQLTQMSVSIDAGHDKFQIHSRRQGDAGGWTVHACGAVADGEARDDRFDPASLGPHCTEEHTIAQFYQTLSGAGLSYGPSFRTVTALRTDPECRHFLATIESQIPVGDGYLIHPTLIDGAFQCLVVLARGKDGTVTEPYVPVSLDRIRLYQRAGGTLFVFARLLHRDADQIAADLFLANGDNEVVARFEGVVCQRVTAADRSAERLQKLLYRQVWEPAEIPFQPRRALHEERWLLLGDDRHWEPIGKACRENGIDCREAASLPAGTGDLRAVREAAGSAGLHHTRVLYLMEEVAYTPGEKVDERMVTEIMRLRELVECLRESASEQKVQVVVVTCAAHVVTPFDTAGNFAASPVGAFARVIENEYGIVFQHIDFASLEEFRQHAFPFLAADTDEREIAVRDGMPWVRRLKGAPGLASSDSREDVALRCSESCVELLPPSPGEELRFREAPRVEPAGDQVEIRVHSAALPAEEVSALARKMAADDDGAAWGFVGTLTKKGSDVEHVEVGDLVMGIATTPVRSFLTLPALAVTGKPDAVTAEQATALASRLEAYHALVEVARLGPGEKILVCHSGHTAALAAVEVARAKGAEIFVALSGTEGAGYLGGCGVSQVYHVGGLELVDRVQADTAGAGIDVVLDLLPGKPLDHGFELLASNGRFVKLAEGASVEGVCLSEAALKKNVTFASVDFSRLVRESPRHCARLLRRVRRQLEKGELRPLPVASVTAGSAADAILAERSAQGHLAIAFEGATVRARPLCSERLFRRDGSYLVTGGTKGFGLEVAKWIAAEGGGTIVLVSRGGGDESTRAAAAEMEGAGARVAVRSGDIGVGSCVQGLVAEITEHMPPLRGVFHAAVVLEDCLLADLSAESLGRSLHAKVRGLANLDRYTRECPVEVFVCFSSVSVLIGNHGQASYVVGNAFLDAFADYRRKTGVPVTSVNFGAVSDVGILARRSNVEEFFRRHGVHSMKPAEVCAGLGRIIAANVPQAGLFDVDWKTLALAMPAVKASPFFAELADGAGRSTGGGGDPRESLWQQLSGHDLPAQREWLQERIVQKVSQVLGIPGPQIDTAERFANMGIDSLSAVELGVALREALGFEFSTVNLLNVATVSRLANEVIETLRVVH